MLGWAPSNSLEFDKQYAPLGYLPGRVVRKEKHLYYLLDSTGEERIVAVAGAFRHTVTTTAEYPVVGDWVAFEPDESTGRGNIHAVLKRRTAFSRQAIAAAGKERKVEEQVLATNVDVVMIVSALDNARGFNVRRIERYLTLAWNSGARPVIVLNKADMVEDLESVMVEAAKIAGTTPVCAVSALRDVGIDALREHVRPGNTLVMLGSSGVGKSSLINRIAGEELMRVGDIRELDARGRHTTTWSELTVLPSGGVLIDTPGLRDVQLWADEASIAETFSEIVSLSAECRFSDCKHGAEPDCAVQNAIREGTLDPGRLASYRTQLDEIKTQSDVGRWMRNSDGRPARRRKRR